MFLKETVLQNKQPQDYNINFESNPPQIPNMTTSKKEKVPRLPESYTAGNPNNNS